MGPNLYHYRFETAKGFSFLTGYNKTIDTTPWFTFNFNVLAKVGIAVELVFGTHAADYKLTILCFNINGYVFFRNPKS